MQAGRGSTVEVGSGRKETTSFLPASDKGQRSTPLPRGIGLRDDNYGTLPHLGTLEKNPALKD